MCVAILRLICHPVDWSGGHSTPAGYRGHWRPRRRPSAEEAPGPPRGKRVPGAEINRPNSMDNQKNNPEKTKSRFFTEPVFLYLMSTAA